MAMLRRVNVRREERVRVRREGVRNVFISVRRVGGWDELGLDADLVVGGKCLSSTHQIIEAA